MQALLDELGRRRPDVRDRIVIHETGEPAPALDGVAAVVFLLADPLREHFPVCFAEACSIADEARACGIRLVNPPEALSNTLKSTQSRIWREHGMPTPVQERFETHAELVASLDRLAYPVILRPDDEHAQQGLQVCSTRATLEAAARAFSFPGVVAPLVDSRAGFVRRSPRTPFSRYYHKKRALVLGDRVLPDELLFSRSIVVASATCTFRRFAGKRSLPAVIARMLPWERRCIEADIEFANHDPAPADLLRSAVHALNLEIAAVDYADLADGGAILWEANPHFLLPPLDEFYLVGPRRLRRRYDAITDAFGDFFESMSTASSRVPKPADLKPTELGDRS
jgi:hypothetical protein